MTILLFGLFGSGKSTIGKILAHDLQYQFIEMDTLIAETLGIKRREDVSELQWKDCQIDLSKDLSVHENTVIATSGNIVENDINILTFKERSSNLHIIYLETSIETLVARTKKEVEHHNGIDNHLTEQYDRRDALYRHFADHVVSTENKTPQQITSAILSIIR